MRSGLRQDGLFGFLGNAFTLIELLVVVTVIGILAALLFPVFARAREKARTSGCQANLKQIGSALQMYRDDYDGVLPMTLTGSISWHWQLYPYVRNSQIFTCPSRPQWYINPNAKHWWTGGYSWNREVSALHDSAIEDPSGTLVVIDSWTANTYAIGIDYAEFDRRRSDEDLRRHSDGLNALYYDGHVKWRQTDSITHCEFTAAADS